MRERGFQALEDEYTASWLHTNQRVTLLEAGSSLRMVIKGLTPGGYLLAEDASGERYELHPDGNRYVVALPGDVQHVSRSSVPYKRCPRPRARRPRVSHTSMHAQR